MSVPRFLVSVLAAFIFISPANAGDIFVSDTDCPKADTTDSNGNTVKGTYATSCKLKSGKCVKTTETQPTTSKGCKKRSYFDRHKAKAETETPSCAAWKACWNEKKKKKKVKGGKAHTNVCNLSTVAKDWMTNQTPLIEDANEKLETARDALQCVIDSTKCANVDPAVKIAATTQFAPDNFGPASVQTTNRDDALKKLTTAQSNLFGQIGDIAKQYNATCRECSVLTDWHLVRTAVYFVNRTQTFDNATDKVGYSSTKTTTSGTPPETKTESQDYEGRFARDPNGTAYIIDNVKTEAFQSDDYKDTVLPGLKEAVCKVAKATSNSKGQSDIATAAKTLQGNLEELADILAANADWVVTATETDEAKKKLALGAKDKVRVSGDAKGTNMCVNGKKTASYNLPTETIDNTKMSDSSLRSKFETLGIAFCSTGDGT